MVKINCAETLKKNYGDRIKHESIDVLMDRMTAYKHMAEQTSSNIIQDMKNFANSQADQAALNARAELLQKVIQCQQVLDNVLRERAFREAGHAVKNSVVNAMNSKIHGTAFKVKGARNNTYTKMQQADSGFKSGFLTDIGDDLPLFQDKDGQLQIADALAAVNGGQSVPGAYGRIASVINKYYGKADEKLQSVGVLVSKLAGRVAPNIHSKEKMLKLSFLEKIEAKSLYPISKTIGDSDYEFAFQRWKKTIIPLLDDQKTFNPHGIGISDVDAIDDFMRHAFDNLVNKGKGSIKGTNFANSINQPRVFHWLDNKSMLEYNEQFGNGSIQDSIVNELSHNFKMVEVIKDWGVNPVDTLQKTLDIMESDPALKQRVNKASQDRKMMSKLEALTHTEYDEPGLLSSLTNSIQCFETLTKMGNVTINAIPDFRNIAKVASTLGNNRLTTYGSAIRNLVAGLSEDEIAILGSTVEHAEQAKLGQYSRFSFNPYQAKSVSGNLTHYMYKLNLLSRFDRGNRGYIASTIAQSLARNKHVGWDALSAPERDLMSLYNIDEHDWGIIRKSTVKISRSSKQYITPDSIQYVADAEVEQALRAKNINVNPESIQAYKDAIERKLMTYFRDRQDVALSTPDLFERTLMGSQVKNQYARSALRLVLQFKSFGVSFLRKTIAPELYSSGATNLAEAINPFSGKSNWRGLSGMAVELMALKYASMTLLNLSKGMTPPDLEKPDTWKQMFISTLGVFDLATQIDPRNMPRSIGNIVSGAAISDISKLSNLGYNLGKDWYENNDFSNSKRSAYRLLKGSIPYNQFYTKGLVNHFILDGLEDEYYPGKRQNDLDKIYEKTGSQPLF